MAIAALNPWSRCSGSLASAPIIWEFIYTSCTFWCKGGLNAYGIFRENCVLFFLMTCTHLKRIQHSFSCYNNLFRLFFHRQWTNQCGYFFSSLPFGKLNNTNKNKNYSKLNLMCISTNYVYNITWIWSQRNQNENS